MKRRTRAVVPAALPDAGTVPTIDALGDGKTLRFHCKFCFTWHVHGVQSGDDGPIHRVAHCHQANSPYDRTGYVLRRAGTWRAPKPRDASL